MKVWKYTLSLEERQLLQVPAGALFLNVGVQEGGLPCVWALVDPSAQLEPTVITTVTTGEEFDPNGAIYLGTLQLGTEDTGSWYVGHIFLGAGYHSKAKKDDRLQLEADMRESDLCVLEEINAKLDSEPQWA